MKKKKFLVLLICLLGSSILATGCSSKKDTQTSVTQGEIPDQVDVKIWRPIFMNSPKGTVVEEEWEKRMEAYLGVDLNITWEETVWADYSTKLSTYLAAGEFADIFTVLGNNDQISELGMTGMLINHKDYPDSTPYFNKRIEGDEALRVTAPDGGIYFFCDMVYSEYAGTQQLWAADVNIFEQNNLKPPTTLNELYDVAKELKRNYPSSYPINSNGNMIEWMTMLSYRTANSIYLSPDLGKYVYGPTEENYKKAVMYLNKLYSEGLLDPEYITQTMETMYEKILNKKSFIACMWGSSVDEKINRIEGYDVEWGDIPYFKADEIGKVPLYNADQIRNGYKFDPYYKVVVNSKTKYPELMLKMADYQYSDEMIELFNYGIEGVTFNKDSEGNKVFIDEIKNAPAMLDELAKYGINISNNCRSGIQFAPQDRTVTAYAYPPVRSLIDGQWSSESDKYTCWIYYDLLDQKGEIEARPQDPPIVFSNEESQKISDIITAVQTYVNENVTKFIMGDKAMSEWETFVESIAGIGDYEGIVQLYNDKLTELNK